MGETPGIVIDDATLATTGRKVGYAVAIIVNGVFLFIVNNILAWDVLPWLTDDFQQVIPVANAAIVASMIAYTIYLAYDPPWFKALAEVVTSSLSLIVGVRMWQIFPFDFAGYEWDWDTIVRLIIGFGILATAIAIIVNVVKLVRYAVLAADDVVSNE